MKLIKALLIIAIITTLSLILTFSHIGRYFFWNFADIRDYKKFPSMEIHHGNEVYHFRQSPGPVKLELPEKYHVPGKDPDLESFLFEKKTVAFLVIRNDTLLMEKYFDGYSRESVVPVFSVAKPVVSALVGLALEEGRFGSVDDPITNYVAGFKFEGFEKITLENLLNMRSGISYSESYINPLSEMAIFYYGKHLDRYVLRSKINEPPDLRYEYMSINPQLLAMALENTTGKPLPLYLEEKIWTRIGMEFDATWSLDSRKHQRVKAFCCLNARPVDMAKFARLYLNEGTWEGEQIISRDWIRKSISITNDSRDDDGYPYHYLWRVLDDGSYFAKGILGQYIYVNPSRNLIILRLGKKLGGVEWIPFIRELEKQL